MVNNRGEDTEISVPGLIGYFHEISLSVVYFRHISISVEFVGILCFPVSDGGRNRSVVCEFKGSAVAFDGLQQITGIGEGITVLFNPVLSGRGCHIKDGSDSVAFIQCFVFMQGAFVSFLMDVFRVVNIMINPVDADIAVFIVFISIDCPVSFQIGVVKVLACTHIFPRGVMHDALPFDPSVLIQIDLLAIQNPPNERDAVFQTVIPCPVLIFQKLVQTTDGIAVNLGNPIIDFDFIIDIRVVGYPEVANGVPLCINVESTLYLLLVVIYNPNVITPMVIVSFYPGYPEQILLDSMFRLFCYVHIGFFSTCRH